MPKVPHSFKFNEEVSNFLNSRVNKTAFIEDLVKKEMNFEKAVYVINLGAFNGTAKDSILKTLNAEGVPIQPVMTAFKNGYAV